METLLKIVLIAAAVGAIVSYFSGEKKGEDAAAGAIGGAMFAGSCLLQLFFYGLMFMAAIWVFRLVFD